MASGALAAPYLRTKHCNRSLSDAGRRLFLVSVSFSIMLFAGYAAWQGAWLVLPFAGLEVLVVVLAFSLMRSHDGDYEKIEIADGAGCFEARDGKRISRVEFNAEWAQIVCRQSGWRCDLALRCKGRHTRIGRLMSDEERLGWARELKDRIRVVRA